MEVSFKFKKYSLTTTANDINTYYNEMLSVCSEFIVTSYNLYKSLGRKTQSNQHLVFFF